MLVDCQREFLGSAQQPARGLHPSPSLLIRSIAEWLQHFRQRQCPVAHVYTTVPAGHPGMPHWPEPRCLEGTASQDVPRALEPLPEEAIFRKTTFSPFVEHALDTWLRQRGVERLILVGLHLHACLRLTAQDAYQRGFRVAIGEGAWGSDDPLLAASTWRYLRSRGIAEARRLQAETYHLCPRSGRRLFRYAQSRVPAFPASWPGWEPAIYERLCDSWQEVAPRLQLGLETDLGKSTRAAAGEIAFGGALLAECGKLEARSDKRPLGRVALVTPFNNPVAIPLGKLLPGLILGNSIVWKPAPPAARISRLLMSWLREAGVKPHRLQLVQGDSQTAQELARHPQVQALSLSGGLSAGWALGELCWREGKPFQAELGGNNACLWWERGQGSEVAREVVESAFGFAGQRCTATSRLYVPAKKLPQRLQLLQEATRAFGWECGPMISASASWRAEAMVQGALECGARVHRPLSQHPGRGHYFSPALVEGCQTGWEIAQVENFAPILVVMGCQSFDAALAEVNAVPQGLVASLYSPSARRWQKFREQIHCGVLKWNQPTATVAAHQPFGGWKASGWGPPEHGAGDLEFWTRWQTHYGGPR